MLQITTTFSVKGEEYKKKKPMPPKQKVMFFDNPPTVGEIHHNQIFKFAENFKKFASTNNKVILLDFQFNTYFLFCSLQKLQLGISQAKVHLSNEELMEIGEPPKKKSNI